VGPVSFASLGWFFTSLRYYFEVRAQRMCPKSRLFELRPRAVLQRWAFKGGESLEKPCIRPLSHVVLVHIQQATCFAAARGPFFPGICSFREARHTNLGSNLGCQR